MAPQLKNRELVATQLRVFSVYVVHGIWFRHNTYLAMLYTLCTFQMDTHLQFAFSRTMTMKHTSGFFGGFFVATVASDNSTTGVWTCATTNRHYAYTRTRTKHINTHAHMRRESREHEHPFCSHSIPLRHVKWLLQHARHLGTGRLRQQMEISLVHPPGAKIMSQPILSVKKNGL